MAVTLDEQTAALLEKSPFSGHVKAIDTVIAAMPRHGDWPQWLTAIDAVEHGKTGSAMLDRRAVGVADLGDTAALETAIKQLQPWRKGPWQFADLAVDSEWRGDLKYDRMRAAVPVAEQRILDIGSGNGYFCFRAVGDGARLAIGVEPTPLYVAQYRLVQRLVSSDRVGLLPLRGEHLPATSGFDQVWSMGVLYHARNPIGHLDSLWGQLRSGGTLVLETLIVAGDSQTVLMPRARYARMRNVWMLPSVAALETWLYRCKFVDVALHDVTATTSEEQRPTPWAGGDSLRGALDANSGLTVEGLPPPTRALLTARKP